MRILLLAAGVAGIAVTAPARSENFDQGRGNGQEDRGRGGGGNERGRGADNGGRGADQADRGRGQAREARQAREERGREVRQRRQEQAREAGQRRQERAREAGQRRAESVREAGKREQERGRDMRERMRDREGRQMERAERRGERAQERRERLIERRGVRLENARDIARLEWEPDQAIGRGCPPGLAKKNNGCMPPGLARQGDEQQSWYRNWWSYPDATNYSYTDGYLVRPGDGGGIESFIPLLGGILSPGQDWPAQYDAAQVPDYHVDYFGLDEGLDYRFADGAIYGVDPSTQLIQQVAALVAGDEWGIGQQMPQGYDIYNVPYEYRDQYQDTSEAMYRYSDGYVYQVDPTTQLIQAAIQLIT